MRLETKENGSHEGQEGNMLVVQKQYKHGDSTQDIEKEDKTEDEVDIRRHPFFNPWVFVGFLCFNNVLYISAIGGYISASINIIERRFQLKSSESGAINIINDVVGMLSILFLTHFGHSRHRPRIVGMAYALAGIGTALCALPHFIYDPPVAMMQKMTGQGTLNNTAASAKGAWSAQDTCMVAGGGGNLSYPNEREECSASQEAESGSLVWQIGWILFGQMLCGVGTCAQPLGITYLDDNVKNRRTTTIFVGIIFSAFAFGPMLGYMFASISLSRPTFFYDPSKAAAVPQGHPYFIGAWWLGFLINGALLIVGSIPFFFFPKTLRKQDGDIDGANVDDKGLEEKETNVDATTKMLSAARAKRLLQQSQGPLEFFKDFCQTIKRTLTNVTAMSVYLATCSELTGYVGWFTFATKYLYYQYALAPAKAALIFGLCMVPGPVIGNILASGIVRKCKLDSRGCAKMVLSLYVIIMLMSPTLYWFGCDNPTIVGINTPFTTSEDTLNSYSSTAPSMSRDRRADDISTSSCNADCDCAPDFVPVCGSDGLTYATACQAGCKDKMTVNNVTVYTKCSCIPQSSNSSSGIPGFEGEESGYATRGKCPWSCNRMVYFFAMMPLGSFLGAMVGNPAFMLQFRSHREEDRSTALGVNNVMMKLFAFIPGPVYFGAIIEKTSCLLFQESCGKTGNCLVYDIIVLRIVFTLFACCSKLVTFALYSVAYFSVRKQRTDES